MLNSPISPSESTKTESEVAVVNMPLNGSFNESKSEFRSCIKTPKKVLHFSDGTLEEFSTDDETDDIEPNVERKMERQLTATNPSTLTWIPWFLYQTMFVGNKALAVCDYFGEYLAGFFGIISPKYEYEIEHYKRMLAEEKEKKKEDFELGAGWSPQSSGVVSSEQIRSVQRFPMNQFSVTYWTHDIQKSCQV